MRIPAHIRWPAVIIGALALHVIVSLVTVWIATSNPSYAVEEDYYQKAIHWDEKRAQDGRNSVLGWQIAFDVSPSTVVGEPAALDLVATDGSGKPLAGATVTVETFHNTRAGEILRARMVTDHDGRCSAPLSARRTGVWEFRFSIEHESDRFTQTETRFLPLTSRHHD